VNNSEFSNQGVSDVLSSHLLAGTGKNYCLMAGRPSGSQLKSTTRTNCCIYAVYLLMMGYKYARNT